LAIENAPYSPYRCPRGVGNVRGHDATEQETRVSIMYSNGATTCRSRGP